MRRATLLNILPSGARRLTLPLLLSVLLPQGAAVAGVVDIERTNVIFAIIIIGREITISALREWMAQMGRRSSVAVATIGKFKTAAQMVAIFLLLLASNRFDNIFYLTGNILMFIASVLTLWSMFYYLKMAWQEIK